MFVLKNSLSQVWCKSGQGRNGLFAQEGTGPRRWEWKSASSARAYRRKHRLECKVVRIGT